LSWSLAVEEWFYIILPLLVWLLTGVFKFKIQNIIPWLVVFFVLGCFTVRAIKFNEYEHYLIAGKHPGDRYSLTVFARLDGLMFGILAAYIFKYIKQFWTDYKKLFFVFGIIIIMVDYVFFNHNMFIDAKHMSLNWYRIVGHYSVLPFAITLVLPYIYNLQLSNRIGKFAIFISIISYSLYLSHLPIVANFKLPMHATNLLHITGHYQFYFQYLFYWLFSIIISMFLYKYFERPMTDIRERLTKTEK
jgi:peptidoglycan/LPS O-acetylase OafA/YrhL